MRSRAALYVLLPMAALIAIVVLRPRVDDAAAPAEAQDDRNLSEAASFWPLYRAATRLRIAGAYDEAIPLYRRALDINPDHEDGLYYLGNLHYELDEHDEARAAWLRLTAVNPGSARGHARLGDLQVCDVGSPHFAPAAATESYAKAMHINRQETGPALRLALVNLLRGARTEAAQQLEGVVSENFQSLPGHFYLGFARWSMGQREAAERSFASAQALARPRDTESAMTGGPVVGEGDTDPSARKPDSETSPLPAPGLAASARLGCETFDQFLGTLEEAPHPPTAEAVDSSYGPVLRFFERLR